MTTLGDISKSQERVQARPARDTIGHAHMPWQTCVVNGESIPFARVQVGALGLSPQDAPAWSDVIDWVGKNARICTEDMVGPVTEALGDEPGDAVHLAMRPVHGRVLICIGCTPPCWQSVEPPHDRLLPTVEIVFPLKQAV